MEKCGCDKGTELAVFVAALREAHPKMKLNLTIRTNATKKFNLDYFIDLIEEKAPEIIFDRVALSFEELTIHQFSWFTKRANAMTFQQTNITSDPMTPKAYAEL